MKRGRALALCVVSACLVTLGGCNDDSAKTPSGCALCTDGQVCSEAGICYDDPDCAICGIDQVCVGGLCFANDSACARCEADNVCVGGVCYGATSPCARCRSDQVCRDMKCYEPTDPCLGCKSDQVCVAGACYEKTDPCSKCSSGKVCVNDSCYSPDDPCAQCGADQVCVQKVCYDLTNDCIPSCGENERCIDRQCRDCSTMCGGECCSAGELCDAAFNTCGSSCGDGVPLCQGVCCFPGEYCDETYGCIFPCSEEQTRCNNDASMSVSCCDSGQVCEDGECRVDCGQNVRCNGICCETGEVCEDKTCKIACDTSTHERCGANEEFCCDNATEICISQRCVKLGNPCTKSSQCNFDEVCEETSKRCIVADQIASTCEVRPQKGPFTPLLQFNWPRCLKDERPSEYPSYYRVITMPMVANMTDDNGDGVVNEDDVPDIIFVAYSTNYGPDTHAPSVLRVISGDDGHEIASSQPRYWTYPISAVVADIDNDGKVEIAIGTNNHHQWGGHDFSIEENDKLEALGVEPDPASETGYKLVTKYAINIGNGQKMSFLSVADLDGDGTPEVVTNFGIASVVKDENGQGSLQWRKGCENKSLGYVHAADLDGDGKMELINGRSIYDDHCNDLATDGVGGQIAIADLMPSGNDAAETGELVPEIAHVVPGVYRSKTDNDAKFVFSKIYKKQLEDGSYQWSIKKAWQNPIPVDEKRWDEKCKAYSGHCNTGGGTPVIADFNGDTIPDVGVATRYYYIVYSNDGTPEGGKVLWADGNTTDYSSAVTGSSVFDFEGDGKAEVVYSDELKLRIYAGEGKGVDEDGDGYNDPLIIWETDNRSATGYEYPIIVDVDNDGSTEIVLSSDIDTMHTIGINVYEDPGAQWVRTRRIWNQHFYHVTNINEDGTVPKRELQNWTHSKLNNYRQNVQPAGVFNAPDLVAKALTTNTDLCSATPRKITLIANVANEGALGVKAGVGVKFYAENVDGTGQKALIGESTVDKVLAPGQSATASIAWDQTVTIEGEVVAVKSPVAINFVVDEPTADKQFGNFVECREDNNTLAAPASIELCAEQVN